MTPESGIGLANALFFEPGSSESCAVTSLTSRYPLGMAPSKLIPEAW